MSTLTNSLSGKQQQKKKFSIYSNLLSFLLGTAFAYLLLQPSCPATTTTSSTSKESSLKCNCEEILREKTADAAASNGDTISKEKNFYQIGKKYTTDKVAGEGRLPGCLAQPDTCTRKGCVKKECRAWGHWYQNIYQPRIGKYSLDTADPFQFLEIGFFNGRGYQTYREFFTDKAEVHSMEISCLPEGKREEGKWPWGNFAKVNENYQQYLDEDRLHCGDAANTTFLDRIWRTKMHRPDAPPLRIVVDDGSHLSSHMAQSFFFWFPRIEPGGLLIIEDIQPITEANLFRTQFLPQIMSDLHYCGDPAEQPDAPCFPLLQKMLQSIHCELHICVFERNKEPAIPDLPLENSTMPEGTLSATSCPSISNPWGMGLETT